MAGTVLGTGNRAEKQTDHQTTLPALVELAFSRVRGFIRKGTTGSAIETAHLEEKSGHDQEVTDGGDGEVPAQTHLEPKAGRLAM